MSDTVGPSCSLTLPPRLKSPSIRFLSSAVVKPHQAGEAYVNLATTALNIIWRLSVDSPWLPEYSECVQVCLWCAITAWPLQEFTQLRWCASWTPTLKPSQPISPVSPPVGCYYHPHPPLPFIITRPMQPMATCCQSPYLHNPAIVKLLLLLYSFQFRSAFRATTMPSGSSQPRPLPSLTHSWTHLWC